MINLLSKIVSEDTYSKLLTGCLGSILGILLSVWVDIGSLIILSLLLILFDCITAISLAVRVSKKYKKNKSKVKFNSNKFSKVMKNIAISVTVILVTYLIYVLILIPLKKEWLMLHVWACGAIIIWQGLSMLENISSCNGAKWAVLLQKILVDKTKRHLDIDLSSIIHHED